MVSESAAIAVKNLHVRLVAIPCQPSGDPLRKGRYNEGKRRPHKACAGQASKNREEERRSTEGRPVGNNRAPGIDYF